MKQKQYTHLTRTDRQEIDLYLHEGKSYRCIGKLLGKSTNTIQREAVENSVQGIYVWKQAHAKARLRRRLAKYQGMKLREDMDLCTYVEKKLEEDWSPEEIAGRLKYRERGRGYVSFFAIYRYLETVWGEKLKHFLRYQRKRYGDGRKTKPIDRRIMIDARPRLVAKRRVFGHWEFDFIVSGKKGKGALLVCIERKTRYALIFKLRNRKVATINQILEHLVGARLYVASVTIDNDVCFRHHEEMSQILNTPIYFCHPYHSWEKGSVENMNKWIRQYIKKGSSISRYSKQYIQFVQERLNNRPRKCLNFYTPTEMFLKEQRLQQTVETMLISTKKHRACQCPT